MAALSEDQKLFVVMRLASFASPSEVLKELKQDFKVEATLQQLSAYDPDNVAGKRLSKALLEAFRQTRERFLSDISDIPIAHQAGRLRMLDEIARQARSKGNLKMAMEAAEQAAKDLGGIFLNKLDAKQLSDDQLCRLLGIPARPSPSSAQDGSREAGTNSTAAD